ncbi:MAG TPA: ATP-binding protein [archaeon]|nr:ATP-binding protein [archaeon]
MRSWKLIWQLYFPYLLITLGSLLILGWYAGYSMREFYLSQTANILEVRANLLKQLLSEQFASGDTAGVLRLCEQYGRKVQARVTLILSSGRVIYDTDENPGQMDNHADRPEVIEALSGNIGRSIRFSHTLGTDMMYLAAPMEAGGEIVGVLRVAKPLNTLKQALRTVKVKVLLGGLGAALLAAAVILLISRRISLPLEKLRLGAEHFARGELEHKLPVPEIPEIGDLARAMNVMAESLEDRIRTVVRQRNELESLLSGMTEGVIAVDKEERVIRLNQAAGRLLGVSPEDCHGRQIQEVVRNRQLQEFTGKVLSSRKPLEEEIVFYYDKGEQILQAHSTLLKEVTGQPSGVLIVLSDVTGLRRLENIRREFVANVSHELKTPITTIKGFVETLLGSPRQKKQDLERFLKIINKQANRLDAIIEDLLSLSRIEQEEEKEAILLAEGLIKDMLTASIQFNQTKAEEKNIRLELNCPADLKARIDASLLEQAVANLIDNAIKYSDPGSQVLIEAEGIGNEVLINVRDKGCGIEARHLPRLFERFYRVDKARSRKLGGTGLGLAIVKHIAQIHRGHVTVQSTPGLGSVFSIHLPKNKF